MDTLSEFYPPKGYLNGPLCRVLDTAIATDKPNLFIFKFPTCELPGRRNVPETEMTERLCTPEEISVLFRHHEIPIPIITRAIPEDIMDHCRETGTNPYSLPGSWSNAVQYFDESFYSTDTIDVVVPQPVLTWEDVCVAARKCDFEDQVFLAKEHGIEIAEFWPNTIADGGHLRTSSHRINKRICDKPDLDRCIKDCCELAHSNRARHKYMLANSSCKCHPVVTPIYCTEGSVNGCAKMDCVFNHIVRDKKHIDFRQKNPRR
jgi:hypothetical protein